MRNNNIVRHSTEIRQITDGSEIICKTCDYHAKWINGVLEIICTGNNSGVDLDNNHGPHQKNQVEAILEKHSKGV